MPDDFSVQATRLGDGPIIHADLDPSIGENIQGPSLIRTPHWLADRLGQYYLYFADHKGSYIRLAYADSLQGPWKIYVPGSLQLAESHFLTEPPPITTAQREQVAMAFRKAGIKVPHDPALEVTAPHIASPDVHVDEINQRLVMYFHGLEKLGTQLTRVAISTDGINFDALPAILGNTYFRGFYWAGKYYGLAMPGQFYRADDPIGPFESGPLLFNPNMRHCAVLVKDHWLWVFWTQVGDQPEHIKLSRVDLSQPWTDWQVVDTHEILRPERDYEGANAPLESSVRSTAYGQVNQLRDPAVFVEGDDIYLLYAVAGESGIALASLERSRRSA
ncbi:MAG: hypothetical protein AAF541_23420 [Pseudomonadota bacterium]